ncbi:hypothetical protein DL89DRAFT_278836 [Linderina pennispora]|uniref:Uncharacterized protein n=1 Tax=Linderina pennispora TaxID=61395 RepID=A0A1Y1W3B9_9FUNG|nr:uncharacterized protein DL89DRAFT_278836 [Linderina pennispora]ORX68020.1 hypothetical protein DL89DRAFT_278836 [Linderina pennispora]
MAHFRKFANPGPLGLSSFALTTFVLKWARRPIFVLGLAFFYGGLCQILAGMWEFASNNTFGATAIHLAGGNVKAHALGIFLLGWVIMTFIFFLATLRTNLGLCLLFAFLDITFILLCAGDWTGKSDVTKAGGYFGLFTALIAWYIAASDLINTGNSYFNLPNPSLAPRSVRTLDAEDG